MIDTTRGMNWGPGLFILGYHAVLLALLPLYFLHRTAPALTIAVAFALFWLTGLAITAGYHRYYAHKSYKTNRVVEFFLLFFGSMAAQGSVIRWAFDHRLHHAHTDGVKDPYSIKRGFWYAHLLWIFEKPQPIEESVVSDLLRKSLVVLQDRFYTSCLLLSNAIPVLLVGFLTGDYIGSLLIAGFLRLGLVHHFTWFINSLAHTWGDKPFSQEQSAVDNFLLSLFTFGEGYHNYHHTYTNDYRNGVRWFHFDPTKWLIWLLSSLGLTYDLRRMDKLAVKKKLVLEGKNLLSKRLAELWYVRREELETQVQEAADRLLQKINALRKLRSRYRIVKKESVEKTLRKDLDREIRALKKAIRAEWRRWHQLSQNILRMQPLPV